LFRGNDAEMPLAAGSRRGLYGDLNVSAKQVREFAELDRVEPEDNFP